MADIIYDDELGARNTEIFGCSFKSITTQMGFNSSPIVFTITVVEENDQDFTLDREDVRSVQQVTFGELSILGIVQSWDKINVDVKGTGIYTIRITDCRSVLDSANITRIYVDQPDLETALINSNVIYVGPVSGDVIPEGASREEDEGILFSTIIERVEAATLHYGNNVFEIDMEELGSLTNGRDEGINDYYTNGDIRSLISLITEFCNVMGAEWWVESRRKSSTDDTVVIQIKVVRRLEGLEYPNAITMDNLAALYEGHIIHRQDGYENQNIVTNKIIWGGVKHTLLHVSSTRINQFWGFDKSGQPRTFPYYVIPREHSCRGTMTSVWEMERALNGELDDEMDSDQLSALKRYAEDFWCKKFYFALEKNLMSDVGRDLPDYPEIITAGWWGGDTLPIAPLHRRCNADVFMTMTTVDGRWRPFVQLPRFCMTASDAVYIRWASTILNSNNLIRQNGKSYMRCTLEQDGRYVILTLPVALTQSVRGELDLATGETGERRITRSGRLREAWIPIMDRGVHYGPWSNNSLIKSRLPSPGRSQISVDANLVPWTFGVRGMSNATAMEQLSEMAAQKVDPLPGLSIINTGQLEVAGVPKVNIGQAIGLGGNITDIFIRFDANGVTTRFTMNLFTKELGEFKYKQQAIQEEKQEEYERQWKDERIEPESALEPEADVGPGWEEYVEDIPEGGMGIISSIQFGPNYNVERVNHRDSAGHKAGTAGAVAVQMGWTNVRNLAEPEWSQGLLPPGTRVTVSIYQDTAGSYVPYIEHTPPNLTLLMTITAKDSEGPYYSVAGGSMSFSHVPNLSESWDGPGYLTVGRQVTVSVLYQDGVYAPYIEQTPPTFAPPIGD